MLSALTQTGRSSLCFGRCCVCDSLLSSHGLGAVAGRPWHRLCRMHRTEEGSNLVSTPEKGQEKGKGTSNQGTIVAHINVKLIPPEYPVASAFVLILIGISFLSHSMVYMWTVTPTCACDKEFFLNLLFAFAFNFVTLT